MMTDFWEKVGEDRSTPLLLECKRDDCRRFIIGDPSDSSITEKLDLYPRELIMTCNDCLDFFLVNLKIFHSVKEEMLRKRNRNNSIECDE